MYAKQSTRIESLTPELAKEIASMQGLPGERERRAARVAFLNNHLKEGSFVGPNWAIAKCRTTGERYRINGQHSSYLLASLPPESFPKDLKVTIDEYSFDDWKDAPGLFNLFDHPRSARSDTDYMGIARVQHSEFAGMDNRYLVKVAAGIDVNVKLKQEKEREKSGDTKQTQIDSYSHRDHGSYFQDERYRKFAVWLYQWRDAKYFSFMGRAGVTSEILDDWLQTELLATEFWGLVFRFDHAKPDHVSRLLAEELKDLGNKPKKVSAAEYQKLTQKFWRKYYRLRISEAEVPARAASNAPDVAAPLVMAAGATEAAQAQL